MLETLMNLLSLCFRPFSKDSAGASGSNGAVADAVGRDGLLWFRDYGRCAAGEFSMAVIQANQVLEDQSQIESGPFGTFVGVYDGHGGPDAARFVCDHLFPRFQGLISAKGTGLDPYGLYESDRMRLKELHRDELPISAQYGGIVTAEIIRRAFLQTEEEFIARVGELWNVLPSVATVGTCCLVGVVYQQTLFVANLGDSRAVLGKRVGSTGGMAAIQLSTEHNANIDEIRHELKELHPDDPDIVVLKHGVWRVKGIIQVSRSVGDAYMKHGEYNREPINPKFRLPQPMHMPYMSANPTIISHQIHPNDSFVMFASDGLWEHLSNEQAVEIVHNHPPAGSAKRLIKAALQEAARKREMRYSDLRGIDKKVRRHFHDDITVIILFLNHDLISRGWRLDYSVSVCSALEH